MTPTNTSPDQILRALAREIKTPLVSIAREAELNNITSISRQASEIMALIDGYLLSAQTDYGQLGLPLETTAVGSILYDVSRDVRELAYEQNVTVSTLAASNGVVMTHRRGLQIALRCLAQLVLSESPRPESAVRGIRLVSYQKRSGATVAGVFSDELELTPKDLQRAQVLYGDSHLAIGTSLPDSGIRLAIAERLGQALGIRLTTLRYKGLPGLGFELIKSEQLQLI